MICTFYSTTTKEKGEEWSLSAHQGLDSMNSTEETDVYDTSTSSFLDHFRFPLFRSGLV
jgi:hypothetical protein